MANEAPEPAKKYLEPTPPPANTWGWYNAAKKGIEHRPVRPPRGTEQRARTEQAIASISAELGKIEHAREQGGDLYKKIHLIEKQLNRLKQDHAKTIEAFADQVQSLESRLEDARHIASLYDGVDVYGEGKRALDAYSADESIEDVDHASVVENAKQTRRTAAERRERAAHVNKLLTDLEEGRTDLDDEDWPSEGRAQAQDERLPYKTRLNALERIIREEFRKEHKGREATSEEFISLIDRLGTPNWRDRLRSWWNESSLQEDVAAYRDLEELHHALNQEKRELQDETNLAEFLRGQLKKAAQNVDVSAEKTEAERFKKLQKEEKPNWKEVKKEMRATAQEADKRERAWREVDQEAARYAQKETDAIIEKQTRKNAYSEKASADKAATRETRAYLLKPEIDAKMKTVQTRLERKQKRALDENEVDRLRRLIEKETLTKAANTENPEEAFFRETTAQGPIKEYIQQEVDSIVDNLKNLPQNSSDFLIAETIAGALEQSFVDWSGPSAKEFLSSLRESQKNLQERLEKPGLTRLAKQNFQREIKTITHLIALADLSQKARERYLEKLRPPTFSEDPFAALEELNQADRSKP